ncbi:Peptidoglycan-binding domain-containing protein, expansin [Lachnospiraceae bacterium]|nr:Peptidoglycan-binding domain-containing protein, expansin [Lachnospiraceae bacterium]
MKNIKYKIICIIMIVALIINVIYSDRTVLAKTKKLSLSSTSLTLTVSGSKIVKVKGSYKIKVTASKKKYVKVTVNGKKIKIKGLKKGNVKLTVKGYKNNKLKAKGTIKVKVKAKSTLESDPTAEPTATPSVSPTASPGQPSDETIAYDAGDYSINKEHSGEGTFYDPEAGGAANLDDFASKNNLYTAAMNNEDYMNGLAGAYVEITDKDGDKINVLIADRLPEGAKGDIDLTRTAFKTIEPEVTGRMNITWKIIPLPTDGPIQFLWKPTSTQYWAQVQIRNNRYPIKKLEYLDAGTNTYKELPREEYNYFTASDGLGSSGPYTFRITDFYGHVLIEEGISIDKTETPVNGKNNFSY